MRKIISGLIAFLILTQITVAFAEIIQDLTWGYEKKESGSALHETKEHLLSLWSDILFLQEGMYSAQQNAYREISNALMFDGKEDHVRAEEACTAALLLFDDLEEKAQKLEDLTDEEHDILYDAEIDDMYFGAELIQCVEDIRQEKSCFQDLLLPLLQDVPYMTKEEIQIWREYLLVLQRRSELMRAYECSTTNYLLLSLQDAEMAERYWNLMPDSYPTLCDNRHIWVADEGKLTEQALRDLDAFEETESDAAALLGRLAALNC